MYKQYNFDLILDRKKDYCRKWDKGFVESKFGEIPDDFIPLWIAEMDFKTADVILERFEEIVKHGMFGYTYTYQPFYDACINWQKRRHDVEVNQEWLTLTYGTVSTIHYLLQAFASPEDYIVMNTPVYDPFALAASRNNIKYICNTLVVKDNRYYIDFEALEQQMIEYRPKVYLFCSPHNPAGRIFTLEEMNHVAQLCKKYNVLLVADEVHSEHIISGKHYSALKLDSNYHDNLIILTSPNKGFNIGGLKTSYSIIPNEEIRNTFKKQLEKNSITSPNTFGIAGLVAAYENGDQWLDQVTEYIKGNYEYLLSFVNEHFKSWKVMKMEASYLVWINIQETGFTATELVKRFASKAGVIIEDGTHYVNDGENYLRINLGTPRIHIENALNRILIELSKD